ncbi:hypothetical protein, partial [Acinetobacter baumannii]|uniref:hypothetical protein n=1 Tax=Acinetobacter baumannii TaxID=470 RepID=UPI001C0697DF
MTLTRPWKVGHVTQNSSHALIMTWNLAFDLSFKVKWDQGIFEALFLVNDDREVHGYHGIQIGSHMHRFKNCTEI